MRTLQLSPASSITVRAGDPGTLEVEALYNPGGSPPPAHLHPAQAEHFEVLEGSVTTRVGDQERALEPGDTLEIPAGTVHQMWNPASDPARVAWRTTPAGRTLEWFEALDAFQRDGDTEALGTALGEYSDVFQLAEPAPGQ
jgi:mannose-6-phosphate isomerase-like protein (cupin superfamily)